MADRLFKIKPLKWKLNKEDGGYWSASSRDFDYQVEAGVWIAKSKVNTFCDKTGICADDEHAKLQAEEHYFYNVAKDSIAVRTK